MESIVENLMKTLSSGDNLSAISKVVGGDSTAVKSSMGMGLPAIMGSMANKASQPGGLDMLTGLLSKVGGNPAMGDVTNILGDVKGAGGSDMLSGLMGGQLGSLQNAISKKTGLPAAAVGQVLSIVAPLVINKVGQMFTSQKMDAKGLSSFLGDQSKMAMDASPDAADIFKQITSAGKRTGLLARLKAMFK